MPARLARLAAALALLALAACAHGSPDPLNQIQGRPVGVVVDRRGGLLVADDAGGMVWRVAPTPARSPEPARR